MFTNKRDILYNNLLNLHIEIYRNLGVECDTIFKNEKIKIMFINRSKTTMVYKIKDLEDKDFINKMLIKYSELLN